MTKILLAIPHVFFPREGSLYSSQTEAKRSSKTKALKQATLGNLTHHGQQHWIHASLGLGKAIVTRELRTSMGADITIQLFTPTNASLAGCLEKHNSIQICNPECTDYTKVPFIASRRLLEQADNYDLIGYMEDDLVIEDPEFFEKLLYIINYSSGNYVFLPHRCEYISGIGDVILSGDPDGGRPDLFWDTGEELEIPWPLGTRKFYRATNPHSGCYFLSREQAAHVRNYWENKNWIADFQLSGPLEQAGSGLLLPVFKLMKPIPEHYRFLMLRHQDQLWKRHPFESSEDFSGGLAKE